MDCIGLSHGGVCLCEVVPVGLPLAWTCQVEFVATWLFRSLSFALLPGAGQWSVLRSPFLHGGALHYSKIVYSFA